jgi:hypothetical protein
VGAPGPSDSAPPGRFDFPETSNLPVCTRTASYHNDPYVRALARPPEHVICTCRHLVHAHRNARTSPETLRWRRIGIKRKIIIIILITKIQDGTAETCSERDRVLRLLYSYVYP